MGILLALRGFLLSCTRSEPLIAVSAGQIFAIVLTFRSPAACSEQSIIARLRDCEIARLREHEIARLRDCEIARLREREIARARDCEIARLRDCESTRLREREIARLREREIARARDCEGTGIETIRMSRTALIPMSRPPARTRGLKLVTEPLVPDQVSRVLPRGRVD